MTDIIMVGCNGRMGQMITGLVNEDAAFCLDFREEQIYEEIY